MQRLGGDECHALCDAREGACGPRAACVADGPVDPDRYSPGVCYEGDDCVVGAEEAACDGPATCLSFPPGSFCLPPGSTGRGEPCSARGDDPQSNCQAGLTCVYGRCAGPCDRTCRGDCVNYAERLGGLEFRFCHEGCEVFRQRGCGDAACTAVDVDPDGMTLGICAGRPGGDARQGEACTPSEESYFGDCHAGHICGRFSGGEPFTCIGLCDVHDTRLCAGNSACVLDLTGTEGLGLCIGECSPLGGDTGCNADAFCRLAGVGVGEAGYEQAIGFCTPGERSLRTGERCAVDARSGSHDCAAGHVCTDLGSGAVCVQLCDGRRNGCPRDYECIPGLGQLQTEEIGVCLRRDEQ